MPLLVNGEEIDETVIEAEVESLRGRFLQLTPEQRAQHGLDGDAMERCAREWSRENVIERTLLRQEALKDAEPIPNDVIERALDEAKKRHGGAEQFSLARADSNELQQDLEVRIRLDRLLGKVTAKLSPPKSKEVAEYYRKHKDQFHSPELVRAAHIVKHVNENRDEKSAAEEIEQVAEELRQGAAVEELADRYSDCGGNGGDLGYFARGQMVEEFDEVVFSMDVGQVSPVFRTSFGFHIAKLLDKQPARIKPLAEVQGEIKTELHRLKQIRAIESFVDQLRARAEIQDVAPAETASMISRS
jgi:parvulin-like peptidyl-prolyl isomerase